MHGHCDCQGGPGTVWQVKDKKLIIKAHSITVNNLFSRNHYHLYLKCAYAKAFINKNKETSFWGGLYDKMQITRIGKSKRDEFDRLLCSAAKDGFYKEHPIPIDQNFQLLDGSHRVAMAYACNLAPTVEVYENSSHSYERSWFESVGFSGEELKEIDRIEVEIRKSFIFRDKLSVGVIWGCAFDHWEEIFKKISGWKLATAFWMDLGSIHKKMAFVEKSYEGDGMPLKRIIDKGADLSRMSTMVGMFAIHGMKTEERKLLKSSIRNDISPKMKNYFFDSIIHIIDCEKISMTLLNQYGGGIRCTNSG